MAEASNALLRGQGKGPRTARAEIAVSNVNIITAGQSVMIGGESTMKGTMRLVDTRTGQQIIPATEITSGGGGWVGGGLIAVATRDDAYTEVRQMSLEFASRARVLVFGHNIVAPVAAAPKNVPAQPVTAADSKGDDLEVRIKKAQDAAELEARAKSGSFCHSLKCERNVERARKDAEARVRREAALESN